MSGIGIIGGLGLLLIVIALAVWITAAVVAERNPTLHHRRGEPAQRGEIAGGEMQNCSPAQLNRRDEAHRTG